MLSTPCCNCGVIKDSQSIMLALFNPTPLHLRTMVTVTQVENVQGTEIMNAKNWIQGSFVLKASYQLVTTVLNLYTQTDGSVYFCIKYTNFWMYIFRLRNDLSTFLLCTFLLRKPASTEIHIIR